MSENIETENTNTDTDAVFVKDSILDNIKKLLNLDSEDISFDTDIIIHINSTFMILNQLGIGPSEGFDISDNTKTWSEYLMETDDLNAVKTYMYLKIKMVFDPPLNGAVMDALKQSITEYEWRLTNKTKNEQGG